MVVLYKAESKLHSIIWPLYNEQCFDIFFSRRCFALETCTWPVLKQYKATGLNPIAPSHTSSRGLGQWKRIMSQPAQTQVSLSVRAHQTAPLCFHYQQDYLRERRAICLPLNTLLFSQSFIAALGSLSLWNMEGHSPPKTWLGQTFPLPHNYRSSL